MQAEHILVAAACFFVGILSSVVTKWAQKGSHFCDVHHNLSAKIDVLTQQVETLINSGTKLIEKMDNILDKYSELDKKIAVINQKLVDLNLQ